ncbi:MAG: flagellar basal body L-ring protein FlgH [Campylobacterales bacterium]|nr:flagellar basal body L-ring protein FlgH [Campylobacterales bacterium]
MKKEVLIISGFTILFSGCAKYHTDPDIDFAPPKYVEEMPPKVKEENYSTLGSLYGKGDNPLFADRKAMNVNDIVTVTIEEQLSSSSSGQKKVTETNSNDLGGGVFAANGPSATIKEYANKINNVTDVGFKTASNSSFAGQGTSSRKENFTTTISARIIKILENGNYFIEGGRELLIDGEKQYIRISGVIRPYDIDTKNTVSSKFIADAKIFYETQGMIAKSNEPNWGSKIMQSVWPF